MARSAPLAAARAQPLRLALRRPLQRLALGRAALVLAVGMTALGLAFVAARETSLFVVGDLRVVGAPPEVRQDVRAALDDLAGTSLVKVDASTVEGELRDLPSVLDAEVDRSFPHTLQITVVPEQPLALIWNRERSWVVSRRGGVIRLVEPDTRPRLPRIWSASAATFSPGEHVADGKTLGPLRALALVPDDFPVRIKGARLGEDGLTFVLAAGTELRLGTSDDLEGKLAAASAVLSSLSRSERIELAYLDVNLPQRPVGLNKSQVSLDG
jgi:cell division protein FtsQ